MHKDQMEHNIFERIQTNQAENDNSWKWSRPYFAHSYGLKSQHGTELLLSEFLTVVQY